MQRHQTAIKKFQRWLHRHWQVSSATLLVALIGVVLTFRLLAAPNSISLEIEKGTKTAPAIEVSDTAASEGKAVQFRTASSLPAPTWSDEFSGTSLSYATDTGGGTWRTKGYEAGGSLNNGYSDYVGSSWNAPQAILEKYGLTTVQDGILTMRSIRNPGGIPGVGNDWISPYLVSNHLNNLTWRYGYFEWRMALPNPSRGMFPALWVFSNVPGRNDGFQSAEVDVLEIFGWKAGQPWDITLHTKPSGVNGVGQHNIKTVGTDTTQWHRYGMNWTANTITIYQDGKVISSITDNRATWYQRANMGIRMDYEMNPNFYWDPAQINNPGDPVPGTKPRMEIDYVRYYSQMPGNLPQGSNDPYK